ncbi:MAG TPA: hypothetical protein VM737_07735 [Gemmatimonadota bacterium]|nr:hypothetical protein [Gemmatimonadota bacterium]
MSEIRVEHQGGDVYVVEVRAGTGTSEHRVTVTDSDVERLGAGATAERLLEESFRFLLEREPAEAILPRFNLPVIARYFPEYPGEIRRRLGG